MDSISLSLFSTVFTGIILLLLPGHLLLFTRKTPGRHATEVGEFIVQGVVLSILITSAFAFLLANLDAFSLKNLLTTSVLFCIALSPFALGNIRQVAGRLVFRKDSIFLALALCVSLLLILLYPLPEWVNGYHQDGIFVSSGVHLAKERGLVVEDPFIAGLPESLRRTFVGVPADQNYQSLLGEFIAVDSERGRFAPIFFQFYTAWVAVLYSWVGLRWLFCFAPLLPILSAMLIYLIGRRLFSRRIGAAASILAMTNFVGVYFSHHFYSETLAELCFLASLYFFSLSSSDDDPLWSVLAAFGFSLAALTRLDLSSFFPAIVAYFLFFRFKGGFHRRADLIFLSAFAVFFIGYLAYLHFGISPNYFQPAHQPDGLGSSGKLLFFSINAAQLLIVLTMLLLHWVGRSRGNGQGHKPSCTNRIFLYLTRGCTIGFVVQLLVYLPLLYPKDSVNGNGLVPIYFNAANLVWFMGVCVVFSAIGLGFCLKRAKERTMALVYSFVAVSWLFWLAIGQIDRAFAPNTIPTFPEAFRIWLPVIFPCLCLFTAVGMEAGVSAVYKFLLRRFLGSRLPGNSKVLSETILLGALVCCSLWFFWQDNRVMLGLREFEGMRRHLEVFDEWLGKNVMLLENTNKHHELAISMRFLFDGTCYVLYRAPKSEAFSGVIDEWLSAGRRVFISSPLEHTLLLTESGYTVERVRKWPFAYPAIRTRHLKRPRETLIWTIYLDLSEVSRAGEADPPESGSP